MLFIRWRLEVGVFVDNINIFVGIGRAIVGAPFVVFDLVESVLLVEEKSAVLFFVIIGTFFVEYHGGVAVFIVGMDVEFIIFQLLKF